MAYNTYQLLAGVVISIFISGCGEGPCYDFKCRCIEELELPCYEYTSESFFSGSIDNSNICFADEVGAFQYSLRVYNRTTTAPGADLNITDPSSYNGIRFYLGDTTLREKTFKISLDGPPVASDTFSLIDELDALEYMDILPLRSDAKNIPGFKLNLVYRCLVKYGDKENRLDPKIFNIILYHSHVKHQQPDDAYLRILEYKKKDLGYAWQYSISFGMLLKLYYYDEKWKVFGTLQDAVFSTQSIVLK